MSRSLLLLGCLVLCVAVQLSESYSSEKSSHRRYKAFPRQSRYPQKKMYGTKVGAGYRNGGYMNQGYAKQGAAYGNMQYNNNKYGGNQQYYGGGRNRHYGSGGYNQAKYYNGGSSGILRTKQRVLINGGRVNGAYYRGGQQVYGKVPKQMSHFNQVPVQQVNRGNLVHQQVVPQVLVPEVLVPHVNVPQVVHHQGPVKQVPGNGGSPEIVILPDVSNEQHKDPCYMLDAMNVQSHLQPDEYQFMCHWYIEYERHMKRGPIIKLTERQNLWYDSIGSFQLSQAGQLQLQQQQQQQLLLLQRQAIAQGLGGNSNVLLSNQGINANDKDPLRHIVRPPVLRKEYRMMTDEERNRFHRAMRIMKEQTIDGISQYDILTLNHGVNRAPGAHFGAAFLGYHREFLQRMENCLRDIDPLIALPYLDTTIDGILGNDLAQQSLLWTPQFLGNGHGDVITGPFAYWPLIERTSLSNSSYLHRDLTVPPQVVRTPPSLMNETHVQMIVGAQSLRDISWFVNAAFESAHGAFHNWMGGTFADLILSPSDPIFYLHHSFIDCLWEQMRQNQRMYGIDPRFDYPNDTLALGLGLETINGTILNRIEDSFHHWAAPLGPFRPLRNIDGLSNIYTTEFYNCAPRPTCSPVHPDCGSIYLFCELNSYHCAPKLQVGAQCAPVAQSDACFNSVCVNGFCQQVQNQQQQLPIDSIVVPRVGKVPVQGQILGLGQLGQGVLGQGQLGQGQLNKGQILSQGQLGKGQLLGQLGNVPIHGQGQLSKGQVLGQSQLVHEKLGPVQFNQQQQQQQILFNQQQKIFHK